MQQRESENVPIEIAQRRKSQPISGFEIQKAIRASNLTMGANGNLLFSYAMTLRHWISNDTRKEIKTVEKKEGLKGIPDKLKLTRRRAENGQVAGSWLQHVATRGHHCGVLHLPCHGRISMHLLGPLRSLLYPILSNPISCMKEWRTHENQLDCYCRSRCSYQ